MLVAGGCKREPAVPSTVTFVDGNTGKIVSVDPRDSLPESMRHAPGADGGLVPVVRVIAITSERIREIHEYGPDGELLRTTAQRRE